MTTLAASPSASLLPPQPKLSAAVAALAVLLATVATILFSGCAAVTQSATTTTTQTNGVVSVTQARSSIYALGDAKAVVDKARASAGKTASVGVSGVTDEATSGNLATNLTALVQLLNALKSP